MLFFITNFEIIEDSQEAAKIEPRIFTQQGDGLVRGQQEWGWQTGRF